MKIYRFLTVILMSVLTFTNAYAALVGSSTGQSYTKSNAEGDEFDMTPREVAYFIVEPYLQHPNETLDNLDQKGKYTYDIQKLDACSMPVIKFMMTVNIHTEDSEPKRVFDDLISCFKKALIKIK